jgi:hypothetical protein
MGNNNRQAFVGGVRGKFFCHLSPAGKNEYNRGKGNIDNETIGWYYI